MSLGADVSREGIDRILGHEVMYIQTFDVDVCVIAHQTGYHFSLGIQRDGGIALQLYCSLTFTDEKIGDIVCAIGL